MTNADFGREYTLKSLVSALDSLFAADIVPILNSNDAISYPPEEISRDIEGSSFKINDNDSRAAKLATRIRSDLLLIMSDVDGVYDRHPAEEGATLLSTFVPELHQKVIRFGEKSNVGNGGMESKIRAACYALENDCTVVICNGKLQNSIVDCVNGKNVGTLFSNSSQLD